MEYCLDVLVLVDPDEIQSAYRGFIWNYASTTNAGVQK